MVTAKSTQDMLRPMSCKPTQMALAKSVVCERCQLQTMNHIVDVAVCITPRDAIDLPLN